jgi:hypothetical protein
MLYGNLLSHEIHVAPMMLVGTVLKLISENDLVVNLLFDVGESSRWWRLRR